MRIRSIRPEFWTSEDITSLSWEQRLIYIGLWSYVDDNGVGRDNPKLIAADLFPLEDQSPLKQIQGALTEYSRRGMITRYTVNGKPFLHVSAWDEHQKINRPSVGRYPLPTREDAVIHDTLTEGSVSPQANAPLGEGEKGRRGEGEKAPSKLGRRLPENWIPKDETRELIASERPDLDLRKEHQDFCDYWHAKAGKDASKVDWDLTWRRWMRNQGQRGGVSKPMAVPTLAPFTPEPPPADIADDPEACDRWYRDQQARRSA